MLRDAVMMEVSKMERWLMDANKGYLYVSNCSRIAGLKEGGSLGSRHSLGLIGLIVWVEPQYYMHSLQPETWQSSDDASDDASES